jgi:predicted dehydrogenase
MRCSRFPKGCDAVTRIKIGIIGCGAIAQIQYLPLLQELRDEFATWALCDLSRGVMDLLGEEYSVPSARRFTDYRDLIAGEVDAVVVCNTGSHAPPAIAAAEAGKHVLVEKPMATTVAEAQAMVAAAERSGTVLMVGYMKRYDPAYQYAADRVREMADVRFVQVNHLHPDNRLHLAQFRLHRPTDLPPGAAEAIAAEETARIAEALGMPVENLGPEVRTAFFFTLYSMIHDIGNLSGLFGPPARVVSADLWQNGTCFTTVLEYLSGFRVVASWVDLPDLQTFEETLEVYGSRERVIVSFPTGFSIGLPSTVTLHGMEANGHPWRKDLSWHENPFKLELLHLRDCIRNGTRPLTDGRDAVADIGLVRDIILAGMHEDGRFSRS